ncbi:MAG: hypothetical protein Q9187_007908, partial [Circinaria calcarea]
MSTPSSTPHSHPAPPHSKPTPRPTNQGLTPNSVSASSPPASGPRSVPSPAYLNAPSTSTASRGGKSPYKAPATGTPGLTGLAGTPVGLPTSSPVAGGVLGDGRGRGGRSGTGSELGLGGGTPGVSGLGGLGIASLGDGLGGGQMGHGRGVAGVAGLGLLDATSLGGLGIRDNEQERQRRLAGIVNLLGTKWGRVSQEGVERCARRLGLERLWEYGGSYAVSGEKSGTLSIAGDGLLVEVEFVGEAVKGVVLSLPGSGEGVARSTGGGAEILRKDLSGEGKLGYTYLDAFAENLAGLARLDQLGKEGVSCFDAIEGVYGSLCRLYEWEMEKTRQDEMERERIVREVQCKQSGRPRMHADGKIGLRLDYWMERRLIPSRKRKADEMEIDEPTKQDDIEPDEKSRVWSALIDCEASPAALYPSIRVSDAWVSQSVGKTMSIDEELFASNDRLIDWLDPPPTFVNQQDPQGDAMNIDSATLLPTRLPNIRFAARLHPPVIVPLQTAIQIYSSVGAPLMQDSIQSTTYTSLLFPTANSSQPPPGPTTPYSANSTLHFSKIIHSFSAEDSTPIPHHHDYTLFTPHHDWARTISEIPFEHPRQLTLLLPILRQWALLGSILQRTFSPNSTNNTRNPTYHNRDRKCPRSSSSSPPQTPSDTDSSPSSSSPPSPSSPTSPFSSSPPSPLS